MLYLPADIVLNGQLNRQHCTPKVYNVDDYYLTDILASYSWDLHQGSIDSIIVDNVIIVKDSATFVQRRPITNFVHSHPDNKSHDTWPR